MDYRKTTAPTNTVTRDMIKLCHDNQDNVYETVMVIAKRANQISNEMKQETTSRSKSPDPTKKCPNRPSSLLRSISRTRFTTKIPRARRVSNRSDIQI